MRSRIRGFTLIELLVVIAIIAILAAILFPVFTAAQKSALKSRCVGNEKQILNAILLYTQDSGGSAPLGYDPGGAGYDFLKGKFGLTWVDRVMKYAKSRDIFICPAVPKAMFKSKTTSDCYKWDTFLTHYGINWRMCSGGGEIDKYPSLRPFSKAKDLKDVNVFARSMVLESVKKPSKTLLIAESQHMAKRYFESDKSKPANSFAGGGGFFVFDDIAPYFWNMRWLGSPYLPQGHTGGTNIGFVDGHVQFVKAKQPTLKATGVGDPPVESSIRAGGFSWWD